MDDAERKKFLGPLGSDHPSRTTYTKSVEPKTIELRDSNDPRGVWLRHEPNEAKVGNSFVDPIKTATTKYYREGEFMLVTALAENGGETGWVKTKYVVNWPTLLSSGAADGYEDHSAEFWNAARTNPKFSKFDIGKIKVSDHGKLISPLQRREKAYFDAFIFSMGGGPSREYLKVENAGGSRSRKYKNKISKKRSRSVHKRRRNNRVKTSRNIRRRVR